MEIFQYGLLVLLPRTIVVLFFTYLVCKVLDMLLGILKTCKNGGYRNRKMRDGIIRWRAEIVAIVFIIIMDYGLCIRIEFFIMWIYNITIYL